MIRSHEPVGAIFQWIVHHAPAAKTRHFKIVQGEADCKFFGPPAKTPTRLVVYKKESSIPQEVGMDQATPRILKDDMFCQKFSL